MQHWDARRGRCRLWSDLRNNGSLAFHCSATHDGLGVGSSRDCLELESRIIVHAELSISVEFSFDFRIDKYNFIDGEYGQKEFESGSGNCQVMVYVHIRGSWIPFGIDNGILCGARF